MRDPIFLTQFGFVAVAVAIVVAVTLHKTVRHPRFPMSALLLSIGVIPVLTGLAWAWLVYFAEAVVWLGRLSILLLLLALVVGAIHARANGVTSLRGGRSLWLAAVTFAGTAVASEFLNGEVSSRTWILLAGFIATWLATTEPRWLLLQAKRVAGLFVVGSGAAALFAPFAWGPYGDSLIGVEVRLHGLFQHANALGPAMLLYLILEWAQPSSRLIRSTVAGTALVLLVLAQSKTAWVTALAVAAIYWAAKSQRGPVARLLVAGLVGLALVFAVVATDAPVEHEIVDPQQVELALTLTGRTAVWEHGIEIWRESPIVGGGAAVFRDYAKRTGQDWAGQAHNQYVQTLGRHGLLGMFGLLLYTAAMLRYGIKHGPATCYASTALVAMILIRTVTESNLDSFSFEQFVVFALLLAWDRADRSAPLDWAAGGKVSGSRPLPLGGVGELRRL